MKKNQALAYIRQLCCLGLDKEVMLAELLRTVRCIIPSEGNVFVGLGKDRYVSYVIPEFVVLDALNVFMDNAPMVLSREMVENNLLWYQQGNQVLDHPEAIWEGFYRSDFFNLVWRPYCQYHCIQGLVWADSQEGGFLHLFRPRGQSAFSESEKALFKHLLIYVAHGLRARSGIETDYADSRETGMLIMSSEGRLIFASEPARLLLELAQHHHYPVGKGPIGQNMEIPDALGQLCQKLDRIFRGQNAPPPILIHTNSHGRFVFRAHWLEPLNREPGGLVGVTIEHREPTVLHLWRGMKNLSLAPMQMEVFLLLAQNHSQDSIGQRLHIKPTTVKDHIRKIYGKLDIHHRDELVDYLAGLSR